MGDGEIEAPTDSTIQKAVCNKWVRLVIFTCASFFTSALYYGWQQYQLMLFQDGAYAWQCPEGVGGCAAQENSISRMYAIAAGCEYASAALGGLFLDHIGPKKSGFIGEMMWMIGTLLVAVSSDKFQAYIPGMIILGSSVNIVLFPALTTVDTFPKWKGIMIGIQLAAQTGASGIPPVMLNIMKKFNYSNRTMWLGYLAFIWLPVTLMYIIALPSNRDFNAMLKHQRKELLELEEKQRIAKDENPLETNDADNDKIDDDRTVESTPFEETTKIIPTTTKQKASWSELLRLIIKPEMGAMVVYYAAIMMSYAYYSTVVRYAISEEISEFMGVFMPSQAAWTLVVGFLCDYFSTTTVMIGVCVCLEFTILCSLVKNQLWIDYVSCIVFVVSQSATFEVKYTFVADLFDPYNFGKLVGLLGIVGGVGTWLSIPLTSSRSYTIMFSVQAIIIPVIMLIPLWMKWRKRQGIVYKTLPDAEPTKIPLDVETGGDQHLE